MSNIAQTAIFPLILPLHILFVLMAVVYVGVRFIKYKKAYQITLILFVALTLVFRLTSSASGSVADLIFEIGAIAEGVLFLLTIILGIKTIFNSKKTEEQDGKPDENVDLK